jgi:uncharacterized membrane protein YGL010W
LKEKVISKRKVDALLDEYGESHQTDLNQKIHFICVPAIFFSLIGLLATIPLGEFVDESIKKFLPKFLASYMHIGSLVIIIGLFYYLRLSFILFTGMLSFSVAVLLGVNIVASTNIAPMWLFMFAIFIVAWIG